GPPRSDCAVLSRSAGPAPSPQPTTARLRSRSLRVEAADDLLTALRDLLGADHVHLVKAT
ncbi:MAG TPA: hypothetical protein VFU41_01325, partial [Gemmatimonadales bacterium]|nr:hypothetical protein [Gemmatimonadales bacterium]